MWCDARAVATRGAEGRLTHILVHFFGWPNKWDEWKQIASGHVRWAVGWQREAWEHGAERVGADPLRGVASRPAAAARAFGPAGGGASSSRDAVPTATKEASGVGLKQSESGQKTSAVARSGAKPSCKSGVREVGSSSSGGRPKPAAPMGAPPVPKASRPSGFKICVRYAAPEWSDELDFQVAESATPFARVEPRGGSDSGAESSSARQGAGGGRAASSSVGQAAPLPMQRSASMAMAATSLAQLTGISMMQASRLG